jgi:hypothetical protein
MASSSPVLRRANAADAGPAGALDRGRDVISTEICYLVLLDLRSSVEYSSRKRGSP